MRVTVLSTDDPIRVFQQLATAASLAPGRIELVAGRGSSTITFPLFDHDAHDYDMLYASKLALLMAVNAGENVTWRGPHRRRPLHDVTVFPRPEEPLRRLAKLCLTNSAQADSGCGQRPMSVSHCPVVRG